MLKKSKLTFSYKVNFYVNYLQKVKMYYISLNSNFKLISNIYYKILKLMVMKYN